MGFAGEDAMPWRSFGTCGLEALGAMSSAPQFQVDDAANLPAHACAPSPRDQLVDRLRQQLGRWEAEGAGELNTFSCGAAAIDRLFAGGGLRHGMLVEWLAGAGALGSSGAVTLGLLGAREACREGGVLVVIDRRQTFYPPAAAAWGIDLDRLIVVHPRNARDELWAAVQVLRSPAVAAMFAPIDRLDSCAFRRLQLAAAAGSTLGVLVRPASARGQPSWADATLEVANFGFRISDFGLRSSIRNPGYPLGAAIRNRLSRFVRVHVVRCHNGRPGGSTVLEIDDAAYFVREATSNYDTHPLPMAPELGDSAGPWSVRA